MREIHRSPMKSPHKGQWRGALMFSLICAWTNGRVSNRVAGDLRHYRAHYGVTVMLCEVSRYCIWHNVLFIAFPGKFIHGFYMFVIGHCVCTKWYHIYWTILATKIGETQCFWTTVSAFTHLSGVFCPQAIASHDKLDLLERASIIVTLHP